MEILKVEHLSKIYGKGETIVKAVDDISFSVEKGDFVAIVGASGSGKSTLLHLLGGVDRPSTGKVFIDGVDIYEMDNDALAIFRRRQVGIIYQFYNLIPILDIEENITLPAKLLHRTTLLEVSALDYMSEEGFYHNFGEYLNRYDTPEEELIANISVISLGNEEYERFIQEIGGNVSSYKDKGILIDDVSIYQLDHYETINVYKDVTSFSGVINGSNVTIPIATRTEKRPMGLEGVYTDSGYIIVSDEFMDNLTYNYEGLYISSNDVENLEKTTNDYLKNTTFNSYVYNVDAEVQANRSMLILVAIFLYGFIIVISLIGITNIFNTITTNMNLRSKEFAMLKSIGMTKHEFNKMVRLESLFYGTKSLVIGIPLGIIGSILIYKAFEVGNDLGYVIPWESIIIASIVVFLLISIIMHFSVKKINKQNIIETIRNDNI